MLQKTTNIKSVTFASDTEPSVAIIDDLKYLCMAGPESLQILCRNVFVCACVCVCVKALDICNWHSMSKANCTCSSYYYYWTACCVRCCCGCLSFISVNCCRSVFLMENRCNCQVFVLCGRVALRYPRIRLHLITHTHTRKCSRVVLYLWFLPRERCKSSSTNQFVQQKQKHLHCACKNQ